MNYRSIAEGSVAQGWSSFNAKELPYAVKLAVLTKCPEKYLLVDRETGQVYEGSSQENPHIPTHMLWKPIES